MAPGGPWTEAGKDPLHHHRFLVGAIVQCQQMAGKSPLCQERLVGSLLQNAAVVHDQNAIGPANGGETVGNDDAARCASVA